MNLPALDAFMAIFGLTRVPNNPEIEPANPDRAQLAALGEAPTPDALTVSVRRPPPAAGHFAD